jgi:hypothetical protein
MTWPHLLTPHRATLVSAAIRHVTDATALLATSPVGAAYLAGYGPECVRKAALTAPPATNETELGKAIGHGFGKIPEEVLALFCALDPLVGRYAPQGWRERFPPLGQWNEQMRYGRSDSVSPKQAARIVDDSAKATEETVLALWADGRLPRLETLVEIAS